MDPILIQTIKKDRQIKKFSAYGFLKNLKFFEPYLIIFLLSKEINLFQIGVLYAVKELVVYIFEVPSGVIADAYGRKKELYLCFVFYIISFVLFFMTTGFMMAAVAMAFFGLGEAFRSGTHKAMIYTYLEQKGWQGHKAFVYGRTRSFSLLGSAISAVLAILLILNIPSSKYIFLASIIPYVLDLLLIMSYPDGLNGPCIASDSRFFSLMLSHLKKILSRKDLRRFLFRSASFEAVFRSVKDYIQPILEMLFIVSGIQLIATLTPDENLKIVLGLTYGVIYLLGSLVSKRTYLLKRFASSRQLLLYIHGGLIAAFILVFFAIEASWYGLIILLFVVMYLMKDMRKPIFVEVCDEMMEKDERATVLSVESQLKALVTIVLAPIIGFIADTTSVGMALLGVGIFLLLINVYYILVSGSLGIKE